MDLPSRLEFRAAFTAAIALVKSFEVFGFMTRRRFLHMRFSLVAAADAAGCLCCLVVKRGWPLCAALQAGEA